MAEASFFTCLAAGGCAGTSVDLALYPIDTVKTRLQAAEGFIKAGGFRGIYKGISAAGLGSAPGAALFFSTYETAKPFTSSVFGDKHPVASQGCAASCGEVAACLVRVPTEIVKQNMQTGKYATLSEACGGIMRSSGTAGFYTGFFTLVAREIPFSFIQFPIYERLKKELGTWQGQTPSPWQGACCGSFAGGVAASVTTPIDVAKTRLMLGQGGGGLFGTIAKVYGEGGVPALFAGVAPRTMWITIGGFVFFGAYEKSKQLILNARGL